MFASIASATAASYALRLGEPRAEARSLVVKLGGRADAEVEEPIFNGELTWGVELDGLTAVEMLILSPKLVGHF